MTPEAPSHPDHEPDFSTPESAQECIDLEETITSQVELWHSRARSPAMRRRNMARFIAEDCEPLDREPINYLSEAGFGGKRTREEAIFMNEYEKRRVVLSSWVNRKEIDAVL